MLRRDVYDWLDRTQLLTLRKMLDDDLGYDYLEYSSQSAGSHIAKRSLPTFRAACSLTPQQLNIICCEPPASTLFKCPGHMSANSTASPTISTVLNVPRPWAHLKSPLGIHTL